MTLHTLTKTLKQHTIEFEVCDGRVIAEDAHTFEGQLIVAYVDLTDYTLAGLKVWLGY